MASYSLTMTNPGWCSGRMTITHTLSSNKRVADVTVTLKLWRSDGGTSYNYDASNNFYITIGSSTKKYTIEKVSGTTGVTKTRTRSITLNADGTLSLAIKVGGALGGTTFKITGNNSKTYKITGGAKKTYKIAYDANGGEGAPASQTKTYGTALTLSSTIPIREDEGTTTFTFSKWKSSYNDSYHYPGGSYTTNAATTMTAVWKTTTGYDITYNGGVENEASTENSENNMYPVTNLPSDVSVAAGGSVTVGAAPTRYGYDFNYWTATYMTGFDGSIGSIHLQMIQKNPGDVFVPEADIPFVARWTPWTHTVQFNANGGTGTLPTSFTKTTGTPVYIEDTSETETNIPTRDKYTFVHWNTQADGNGVSFKPGDKYTYLQNGGTVTLYAIWVSNDILLYSNGNCEAIDFIEGGSELLFFDDGSVQMPQFVEGNTFSIATTGFNLDELIEK